MIPPIILTAFGTSSTARTTYNLIESGVKDQFPTHDIYWGFTSGVLQKKIKEKTGETINHPLEIIEELRKENHRRIIVQSLHLFSGSDFHTLFQTLRKNHDICTVGNPILTSPDDYLALMTMLAPIVKKEADQAILVVGHGTSHPTWPVYTALEHLLQTCFGSRLFVGTVEHYPDTRGLEKKIKDRGFQKVYMIPLFLVTGLHYRRDMMGDGIDSWKTRLEKEGLEVRCLDKGLGELPGFSDLICSHIRCALDCPQWSEV
ncbi:sirohydrochlorin cobaltochelatase [Desulfopila sp. IMCC35008]|uniref:sirohydrochlorin cobaltochelatase n=1 Tax=Desulfopila sp. IMCC35008 TaxID=2653858 RepID=UPI0013D0132E|nr:sirohydrochlorin cobaltochelatase [Desulfopila sp. IMCC35008]